MADPHLNSLFKFSVGRDRKGMAPNKPLPVMAILDVVGCGDSHAYWCYTILIGPGCNEQAHCSQSESVLCQI